LPPIGRRSDPISYNAEYGANFCSDVEQFVSREVVEGAVMPGIFEIPPQDGVTYKAFVDAAGGSGSDSFTLGIAFRQDGETILAAVRERKPPFSPDSVVEEYAALMKIYGIHRATADKWAAMFAVESFRRNGITLEQTAKAKSDIYAELLPTLNSGKARLLDIEKLLNQLCGLERKTARGGRDSIDHGPGGHDDVVNAAAGALVEAAGLSGDGFDMETYIKAYGEDGAAAAVLVPLPPRPSVHTNQARLVQQERQFVPPRDPNGDAPAIVPKLIQF
jgi:hypothetical protein